MPIKINEMSTETVAKIAKATYTPKFFSKDITGAGKNTGVINRAINPINLPNTAFTHVRIPSSRIKEETNKWQKSITYPIDPLCFYDITTGGVLEFSDTWAKIGEKAKSVSYGTPNVKSARNELFIRAMPVAVKINEPLATTAANQNSTNNVQTGKTCNVTYCIDIIERNVNTDANGDETYGDCVAIYRDYTENPRDTFTKLLNDAFVTSRVNAVDIAACNDYIANYDVYTQLCEQSRIWQTDFVDMVIKNYDAAPKDSHGDSLFPMDKLIRYVAQYKITLAQYKVLYDELKKRFNADDIKRFTKMNTSLLLQDTLDNLSQTQFAPLPKPGSTNMRIDLSWCSKEQFDAITSAAPLNQVQAGAGTGKSTVIKARLDYLKYLGVNPDDVMVLSFTNAAADNIKARCPGIQSMTIAKMIDTIYTQNHPKHQLSPSLSKRGEGSTFTNSLEMYRNTNQLAAELIYAVNEVEKHNDYATLLRLVEENYNDVIALLDTVGQTTFQLEIILCYLEHATMQIPFNIKHLLIDEVQDNAVFEFIFFLNLTCKLKNHLYLVGDSSQTLYEFRASDPKALNAIENSGLFSTFPLNINYRSNQDILTFANALLDDIEANQFAQIQLQSFKLNRVTKQSFQQNVILNYNHLKNVSEMNEDWVKAKLSSPSMLNWINDKFSKHEQICVLCYKRRDAEMFKTQLEKLFPGKSLVFIIPQKNKPFAYFSRYVSNCHQQMLALPTNDWNVLYNRLRAEIIVNLNACHVTPQSKIYNYVLAKVNSMLNEWNLKNATALNDELNRFKSGAITHQRFIEIIGESLIDFEIKKNALKQTILSQKNAVKKEDTDNADIIFSTIHSAKGLEYDNVILLYHNKNLMDEDDKRMYYVGLTRAKKSEYILAYDTVGTAMIQTRYDNIVDRLPDESVVNVTPVSDADMQDITTNSEDDIAAMPKLNAANIAATAGLEIKPVGPLSISATNNIENGVMNSTTSADPA